MPIRSTGFLAALLAASATLSPALALEQNGQPQLDKHQKLSSLVQATFRNPKFRKFVESLTANSLRQGESLPNFEKSGIDIFAVLSALPGGVAANVIAGSDASKSIDEFVGRDPDFGPEYERTAVIANLAGKPNQTTAILMAPGVWMVIQSRIEQRGNAICSKGGVRAAIHANRPWQQWTDRTLIETLIFAEKIRALKNWAYCSVYDRTAGGSYVTRDYQPDGTSLPNLSKDDVGGVPMRWEDAIRLAASH